MQTLSARSMIYHIKQNLVKSQHLKSHTHIVKMFSEEMFPEENYKN
jgi:hypothetical protein